VEAYDRTDLQLDVDAPLPAEAEFLHVCVAGVDGAPGHGELDLGAGNGRAAFTGLAAEGGFQVTVQAEDAEGVVLGTAVGELGVLGQADLRYVLAPWTEGEAEPCRDAGRRAPDDAETWLLGVRFAEAPWS